ncbi:mycothiol synthase [Bacillus mesophilus]|uniref:GNAT family N-acetyltransferase n=1 Tax=Bacillus mesophilus TaxID=1808955 RepID=A0A6M0Q431_9BACI|nr:GNAT family N-acetyltransferase [Bacillus mesophilus]MBM7660246.1 mycothiol synthase [Bacillus mesophilus]NEY70964.1 GNAT family N-acetyltransferase [Bacillus mesophilus]
MKTILENFTVRSPQMTDAERVTEFVATVDIDEFGFPDIEVQDVIDLWNELSLTDDVWVIETRSAPNQVVGYGFVEKTGENRLYSSAFVHPNYRGKGIGSHLLQLIDTRASEIKNSTQNSLTLDNVVPATNKDAINLVSGNGYHFHTLYQRMRIDMSELPEVVSPSEGLEIKPYQAERDSFILHAAHQDSFQDTRGFTPVSFEDWMKQKTTINFDQSFWFVAYADNEVVGFIICKIFDGQDVYIDSLGVKRDYRKHGLGLALINTVFREAFQRGNKTVLISVDSDSLTKANLLYEKAGFKTLFKVAMFQKEVAQ